MNNSIVRALVIGLALAIGSVALFLLLYAVVFAGMESLHRLLLSLCVPPAVMLVLIGGFYVLTQDEDKSTSNSEDD